MGLSMPSLKNKFRGVFPWVVAAFAMAAICCLATLAIVHPSAQYVPVVSDDWALWQFLTTFGAATIILLLLLKKFHSSKFFTTLYLFAVAVGVGYLAAALIGPGAAILAASAVILVSLTWPIVAVHDAILLFSLAGIAATLGNTMRPTVVLPVLVIISFYDIIAVYGTKHMVSMAESLLRHKALFAMILPVRPRDYGTPVANASPGNFIFLGTGDFVFPAILVASAARHSIVLAFATSVGAVFGVVLLRAIVVRKPVSRPMPALPPIAVCAILGYALAFGLNR